MTSDVRIRDLDPRAPGELDTVTHFCMRTVLETIPEFEGDAEVALRHLPNFTFEQMRAMVAADLAKPTHRFLVAVDAQDRIVGHSMISRKVDADGRRYGSFFSRYVEPAHRRRGIGRMLMTAALAWFDAHDLDYLLAHTHAANEPLRRLFESHGFRVAERAETPWPHVTLRHDR